MRGCLPHCLSWEDSVCTPTDSDEPSSWCCCCHCCCYRCHPCSRRRCYRRPCCCRRCHRHQAEPVAPPLPPAVAQHCYSSQTGQHSSPAARSHSSERRTSCSCSMGWSRCSTPWRTARSLLHSARRCQGQMRSCTRSSSPLLRLLQRSRSCKTCRQHSRCV